MADAEVNVHPDALLSQAKVWDAQSTAMGKIATAINDTVAAVAVDGLDSWLFSEPLTAYKKVSAEFGRLSSQGQKEMQSIADALVQAARNYEATERANIGAIDSAG
ncbi:MAG TPA: type VII secretion target [Streptosporangiaceae bacterium]|nr:type VII secretion target [Streptosporangiaceae bacterium]